jgi:hypothetical protein
VDVNDFLHHFVLDDFFVGALYLNSAFVKQDDVVSQVQEVDSVSAQDSGLLLKHGLEDTLEDLLADFSVES